MPLNGGGTASPPAGSSDFTPDTTIESSKIDALRDDIYTIFNTARPVAYGGTGASTAVAARVSLDVLGDLGGLDTVSGTANSIILTTARTVTASDGAIVTFKAGGDITGASEIIVDSIGVKAIRRQGDTATQAGDIIENGKYMLCYDSSANTAAGAWILLNREGITVLDDDSFATANSTDPSSSEATKAYVDRLDSYIKLSDVKATSTDGGDFTSGSWQTRVLNTEDSDVGGNCTLSSNQFTLAAGTYYISATAPAYDCDRHMARLYNTSDTTEVLVGTSSYSPSGNNGFSVSEVKGRFTIASTKTFELQHQCGTTKAGSGFGVQSGLGTNEVYSVVELWKLD